MTTPSASATDRNILDALRQNSRLSSAAIARQVGLTPSTVKRRIEALTDSGVISRFTIDTARPRQSLRAVVEVFCRGNVSVEELRALVSDVDDIVFAVTVAGAADAVLVVEGDSAGRIAEIVETIRASTRVDRTRTSIVFDDLIAAMER